MLTQLRQPLRRSSRYGVYWRVVTKTVKTYWWNEAPNFGDAMNPLLLRELFGVTAVWAPLREAELTAAGSVIQWITPVRRTSEPPIHVWGSGFIWGDEPRPIGETVIYHAVRGPATARLAQVPGAVVYGDPGLLASYVHRSPSSKRYRLGLVPHLRHKHDPGFAYLEEQGGRIIDVTDNPSKVIEQIAECEVILSSSLHGLIVADSYDTPNLWITCEPQPFGGSWKFDDYYEAFGLAMQPMRVNTSVSVDHLIESATDGYCRRDIGQMKEGLLDAFPTDMIDDRLPL